jgi:hypothetical protein
MKLTQKNHRIFMIVFAAFMLVIAACSCGTPTAVSVINSSSAVICHLYISPSTNEEWGNDVLGTDTLDPGETLDVPVEAGTYDFMASDCDGNEIDSELGVDVPAGQTITWTFTDN